MNCKPCQTTKFIVPGVLSVLLPNLRIVECGCTVAVSLEQIAVLHVG